MLPISIILFLALFSSYTDSKRIVVTNNKECTYLVRDILDKNGSLIDGGIAAILCEGVMSPQDTGIGGGFVGVFKIGKKVRMIQSRENTPRLLKSVDDIQKKAHGNIGVPSQLKGLGFLHKKYGKLPWHKILKPIVKLCYKGVNSPHLLNLIRSYGFEKYYPNNSNRALCKTLESIAIHGPNFFYTNISKNILNDLSGNSFLSQHDFRSYYPRLIKPSVLSFNGIVGYSTAYPGPGEDILKGISDAVKEKKNIIEVIDDTYSRIYEERFRRYVRFSRPVKRIDLERTHGTSNICIQVDNDGLCFTSTINNYFGSGFISPSTGVILNNQLDDLPEFYKEIKKPVVPPTSASTTLFTKKGNLFFMLGGTGGNRIPAGVLNVANYVLAYGMSLDTAIRMPRIYSYKKNTVYETCSNLDWCIKGSDAIINSIMSSSGTNSFHISSSSYNTVTGILNGIPVFDPRRGGLGIA